MGFECVADAAVHTFGSRILFGLSPAAVLDAKLRAQAQYFHCFVAGKGCCQCAGSSRTHRMLVPKRNDSSILQSAVRQHQVSKKLIIIIKNESSSCCSKLESLVLQLCRRH